MDPLPSMAACMNAIVISIESTFVCCKMARAHYDDGCRMPSSSPSVIKTRYVYILPTVPAVCDGDFSRTCYLTIMI